MDNPVNTPSQTTIVGPRCLSIDLEVGMEDRRIHAFAAVHGETGRVLSFEKGNLATALDNLDAMANTASFLLGHNLIAFDLPHLAAAKPDLRLLRMPAVDTLRLNPLAFPRNPYHHLVKHYQDGQLQRGRLNDPELDARLALDLFRDQFQALRESAPDLLLAWHWLTTFDGVSHGAPSGLNAFFATIRRQPRPTDEQARAAIARRLDGQGCATHGRTIASAAGQHGWALAYALSWLAVAGGNSVMPPWVRHQFPEAGALVRKLRDSACDDPACGWCRERHDARKELMRWFGFPDFRAEPANAEGYPLQRAIVEAAMRGEHVLGILPTGTGKSLCYQIPALSRYDKTGALTVVISPLVALMADQVAGLQARSIGCCAALNGLLPMPERSEVLDRVRLGDIGILIVSPEQLRGKALRRVLAQREIGAWVLDEAHCLSKWGHDFRPDYRYVGRFIKERAGDGAIPPVLCLTATAKPDVVADIVGHFRDKVGIALHPLDGGTRRNNLELIVARTTPVEKFAHIHQLLEADLPPENPGGAIVYCASRRQTEEIADFLREKGWSADRFHARLPPETKKSVQQRFIGGELRVIAATNAFGMGIDKPDVRLVIHADIPGSLENYLQEAGRAGRDRADARCVLLYTPEDVERQFGMSAHSRLTRHEIQAILRSLKRLDGKKRANGELIATTGEILSEDVDGEFERDSATDDTRVRTALAWLEEAALLSREENYVQIFPSSLRIATVDEAKDKLANAPIAEDYRRNLLALVAALIAADPDEGLSTDMLAGAAGLSHERVRTALHDLERLGIASNDTALTAFVHVGIERSSQKRYEEAAALEVALIAELREAAPDLGRNEPTMLHLRRAAQRLKDAGHAHALPDRLLRILKSLETDGRGEDEGKGSVHLRKLDAETVQVTLLREWPALTRTAELRRAGAQCLLGHLLSTLPPGVRGLDLLAETTLGQLRRAIEGDLALMAETRDPVKLLDRALLWLHEQEAIRLNKGMAVFRQAMTIRLAAGKRGFAKSDFAPLQMHYDEQVVQIHVMAEYVQRGLQAMADAIRLALDYFELKREDFMRIWLPGRDVDLARQTTPASWHAIVESLGNPVQQRIVADEREETNVLVLAGPGSGKTRVLVHRIAWLVRVRRENPHGILALAYNRHAAVDIRQRLAVLIGDDAKGVAVMTCHALAMRLAGASFADRAERAEKADSALFDAVLRQAIALLRGEGLAPDETDEQRDRLLAGFRWILVDEYQDIGHDQYELISALAGRAREDTHAGEDGRVSLFAVGDDDQNIYAFQGASVDYIRRFEQDYAARPAFLVENYRSTHHIVDAANRVIAPAARRMKAEHPISVNRARARAAPGGAWATIDPVASGRVQLLSAGDHPVGQAVAAMTELRRLASLSPDWDWSCAAVIARDWATLAPMRAYCELHRIPVQTASEDAVHFWRLRETQALLAWLTAREVRLADPAAIARWLDEQPAGPWWDWLREAVGEYALETGAAELPRAHFIEWLAEWGRSARQRQTGLLLLTAHSAKGLEFDHVAVLDGDWERTGLNEDADAPRRLLYVAMTRARKTLALMRYERTRPLLDALAVAPSVVRRTMVALPAAEPQLHRRYLRLTPKDIDIGYAGRHAETHNVHRAIAALSAGMQVTLRRIDQEWELIDGEGRTVGRMARAFVMPAGMRCVEARVVAIQVRFRDDSEATYRDLCRCERWEVVMPELVLESNR
jgi:ATP-dependent DNA helicase RecQ